MDTRLTKAEFRKARAELREWLALVGETKTRHEKKMKWKEILRDAMRDKEQVAYERERRQSVLASRADRSRFDKYKKSRV